MHTSIAPAALIPASFSVVAERFRRAGQIDRAVALCREGLEIHPNHLSARVTLGCALLDLGQHLEAHRELQAVLKRAPDNLAAIRGLAELHARGVDEQDAHDMQEAREAHERLAVQIAPETQDIEDVGEWQAQPILPAVPVSCEESAAVVALSLSEFDPPVELEPLRFEIEDVMDEAEEFVDLDEIPGPLREFDFGRDESFDHEAAVGGSGAEAPGPSVVAPEPIPVPSLSAGPIAVLDEWLSRIRARRSELLSEYAAS